MSVTVQAPAKINLVLDVVGRREDGYHELDTVFQSVDWYDRITVEFADTMAVCCDGGAPQDETNTVVRAANRFLEYTGREEQYRITVEKDIPMQAGLGGGSADAAGTLVALDRLTGAGLSQQELLNLAAKVGADVPFCLMGGTVLAAGIGEELTPLPPFELGYLVLVKPEGGVSTPEAYRLVDSCDSVYHPSTGEFCKALQNRDVAAMAAAIGNTFEAALALPACLSARDRLLSSGAVAACMSGSGTAVFGWFLDEEKAARCAKELTPFYSRVRVCRPCNGIIVD